ncbi:hypothetical protein BE08_00715 [Sorangium cellulosum]|uniref:Uncharacterized protein n=1 Tax=Sorangium cellulosum TaxID=56 RepID=A0A150PKW9_SORCE|nr:hypothetical protein BE08_00715 [Sorangium cellulosum]
MRLLCWGVLHPRGLVLRCGDVERRLGSRRGRAEPQPRGIQIVIVNPAALLLGVELLGGNVGVELLGGNVGVELLGGNVGVELLGGNVGVELLGGNVGVELLGGNVGVELLGGNVGVELLGDGRAGRRRVERQRKLLRTRPDSQRARLA